jgi:hypothetical protein
MQSYCYLVLYEEGGAQMKAFSAVDACAVDACVDACAIFASHETP